jgi:hypothetical protein
VFLLVRLIKDPKKAHFRNDLDRAPSVAMVEVEMEITTQQTGRYRGAVPL